MTEIQTNTAIVIAFYEAFARADLAAFDLQTQTTIIPEEGAGMGRNTPFAGRPVLGDCVLTMVGGRTVHRRGQQIGKTDDHELGDPR